MKRWMVWMLPLVGIAEAQNSPLTEYWTGVAPETTKRFTYTGTAEFIVGGTPVYTGSVYYSYQIGLDTASYPPRSRYVYSLSRSDASGLPMFNYTLEPEPIYDFYDTITQSTWVMLESWPFADVPTSGSLPWIVPTATEPVPNVDSLSLLSFFDQFFSQPLLLWLDPDTSVPRDTLYFTGNETFDLTLVETLPVGSLPFPLPPSCITNPSYLAHHYRLVLEDAVHMRDGSLMLLSLNRHFWMVPKCFIVKDSVYRTLSPLVGKRGKVAQNQTYNGSVALESITPVQEIPPDRPAPIRLVLTGGYLRLAGLSPSHRVWVLDGLGRRVPVPIVDGVLRLPRGVYTVVVETTPSGSRWVLKGISVR